jgi:CRISPR type III-B/RAMP module-associated protein Cmr3
MKFLELTPLDVFTIRDARPFDVGGVVHAASVWPPPPWTLLGALRGALVETLGVAVTEYAQKSTESPQIEAVRARVGQPDGPAKFAIGPALLGVDRRELRWPAPADLLAFERRDEGDKGGKGAMYFRRLRVVDRQALPEGTGCSVPPGRKLLLPPADESQHPTKRFPLRSFSAALLEQWLAGAETIEASTPQARAASERTPDLGEEVRVGIQLDPEEHTVVKGRFYVRQVTTLGLGRQIFVPVIEANGLPWEELDGQCVRLGADGHLARISCSEGEGLVPAPRAVGNKARLLCLSPLRTEDVDRLAELGLTVFAVAARRAVRIGGWMLTHDGNKQKGPRPLRTYYPAGTVLFVSGEDLARFHFRSVAHDDAERAAGFGVCLVGAWNE